MSAAPKVSREPIPAEQAEKSWAGEALNAISIHGREPTADVQKQWMNIATQHEAGSL